MTKSLNRTHFLYFTLSAVFVLALATVQSAAAMHQMDQRNVTVGPDGTTYVIGQQMDMMGSGMNDPGMELTLYAVGQDNRVVWSYRLESAEATAPVVGTDGTVYVILFPMHDDHERQNGGELGPSQLYAIRAGNLKWSYQFEGGSPSAPVLGPQRTIYFSTNCLMMEGRRDPDDMGMCEQETVALFAVEDRQTAGGLLWSRDVEAMMISEPVVQVNSPTEWTISVSGLLRDRGGMGGGMMGVPALFRFRPDGTFQTIRLDRGGHM